MKRLGIGTKFHALRHYSATELILAGVDLRAVAGRLGHSGGGATTLRVYSAWLEEADQRAANSLAVRMPPRPSAAETRAEAEPTSPYQALAAKLRSVIEDGSLPAGSTLPTYKELARTYRVSVGTAYWAVALLTAWGLIDNLRGKGATVATPPSTPPNLTLERSGTVRDSRTLS